MTRRLVPLLTLLALLTSLPASALAGPGDGRDRTKAEHALEKVKELRKGIGVRTGRELTPALAELWRRRGALDKAERSQVQAILARPSDGVNDQYGDGYAGAEATPVCTTHFCVHYVTAPADPALGDAPPLTDGPDANLTPDYVDAMAAAFENDVYTCENGSGATDCGGAPAGLAWPTAKSDGTKGGDGKVDVYIKNIGSGGIYGYAAPDNGQPNGSSLYAYLVMDNDYSAAEFPGYADPLLPMKVTAAHEYNHVLQFNIDANEDTWMFESTATWAEDKVYPAINDYVGYMDSWVARTSQPLTAFPLDDQNNPTQDSIKVYGSAVWNHFIAQTAPFGDSTILDAWEAKTQVNGGSFAPASYSTALSAPAVGGRSFSEMFDEFAAAVAEWNATNSVFPDAYPDVPASARPSIALGLQPNAAVLNHTTFAYRNIPPPAAPSPVSFTATLPAGLAGAVALVGRTGSSITSGAATTVLQKLPAGGSGTVTLPPGPYGRITAVLVNSDPSQSGWGDNDWVFTKDNQSFTNLCAAAASAIDPLACSGITTGVTKATATIGGVVNPQGQPTTYRVEYGTTTSYGSETTPVSAGSGTSASPVSVPLSGLTPGTTYHYRVTASNGGVSTIGADRTFTTAALAPPVATTGAATSIAPTGATLNGSVDPRGQQTTFVFEYGKTTSYGSQVPLTPASAGSGAGSAAVSAALAGLEPSAQYHFRVVATNADGTTQGADQAFTTAAVPPSGSDTHDPPARTPRALGLTLALVPTKLRTFLAKGLKLRTGCGETCSISVKVMLSAKDAKRLGVKRTIATVKRTGGTARLVLTLKVSKKVARKLAKLKSLKLSVSVSAVTADGRKKSLTKPTTLRR